MKVKTLVAVVVSSLLAASFAYATPSMSNAQLVADDSTSSQPPADATTNPGAMDSNSPTNPTATSGDTNNMPNGTTSDSSSVNPGSDEESSPDTATGDSDY